MLECWTKWIEERDRADFLTLDHMLHKQSAQRIPTLLLLLIGKFLPEKSQIPGIEGDIKSWRRDVFSSFISANINHCLFPKTSPFCDDSSIKKIEATLPKTLANGVKYSGLTFHLNNGDFYFTMSDEKSLRAPNNAFDPDYRDAWSIYWILWSIKPEWIRQEKVKSTKKPKAYEHLTPIEKLIFDKLSDSDFEFKIMEPTDEDDDHGLSAPFLTCQNLLCYMKQSLSVSETELKKALSHRYRILILDGNDSVIDNVKRVQNALRT
jgi:hypothetical protein